MGDYYKYIIQFAGEIIFNIGEIWQTERQNG